MKIIHVIIAAVYKEGYGYQENILPAKHVELGLDTYIVSFDNKCPNGREYISNDGVKVCLLPLNKSTLTKKHYLSSFVNKTQGLYPYLDRISPDIIFIHGLQSIDSLIVYKWCEKHPNVKLYVDQHADYYNSPITKFSTRMYYKIVYGYIAKKLSKYAIKFWGVTPWRVDYLQKVYGVNPEKTDLLVMGGDEALVDWNNRVIIRKELRIKYNIPDDAFLIVTGGKIDKAKNIHFLVEAVGQLKEKNVFLLVFGSLTEEMKNYCTPLFKDNVQYIGWLDSKDVYPYFLSADLAVFPGTHSVLWEQAMSCGVPGIFKDWDGGFSHIDCGGNAMLLKEISTDVLIGEIDKLLKDKHRYKKMKSTAENIARKEFSYIEIAKKAIGISTDKNDVS